MIEALVPIATGVIGVSLGAWLTRQRDKHATDERLLVEALNDMVGGIADVANGVAGAQARYASALSRVVLHGSPKIVDALSTFQDDATTTTLQGRRTLVAALQQARSELGHLEIPDEHAMKLLFGPSSDHTAPERATIASGERRL